MFFRWVIGVALVLIIPVHCGLAISHVHLHVAGVSEAAPWDHSGATEAPLRFAFGVALWHGEFLFRFAFLRLLNRRLKSRCSFNLSTGHTSAAGYEIAFVAMVRIFKNLLDQPNASPLSGISSCRGIGVPSQCC